MKLTIEHDDDGPFVQLTDIFNGISIKTDAGNFGICQRDQGIEIHLNDGPWFSWQEEKGPVKMGRRTHVEVGVHQLMHLLSFTCEHGETDSCDPDHGECCQSCWARRLANTVLCATDMPPEDPGEEPNG